MRRGLIVAAILVVIGLVVGATALFVWTIDETHFTRPDKGFDRLATRIGDVPTVSVEAQERWVEAPAFIRPTSWISLTVDRENLPEVVETVCDSGYADPVTVSLRVRTDSGDIVSVHPGASVPGDSGDTGCLDTGFDAVALIDEVARVRPGVDLQASVWDNGRFALVAVEEDHSIEDLLPLVDRATDLRDAAGLESSRPVEINSLALGVTIETDESDRYVALLSVLAEDHGVTSFSADSGGTQIDGVDKVQIVAPDGEHGAIEDVLRASDLSIADLPVRFLPTSD